MNAVRVERLLAVEVRLQWRHRIVALVAALTAVWAGLLLAMPPAAARTVAPWLLVLETALVGTAFAGALVLLERGQGVLAALATSPLRLGEYLASKLGLLTALVLASAAPIALAGRIDLAELPGTLAAIGLTAVLTMLVAVAVAARAASAMAFLAALPLALLPLLVPAIVHAAGLGGPLLYAVPTTGAMDVVHAGYGGSPSLPAVSLGWLALACAAAAVVTHRQLRRFAAAPPAPATPNRRAPGRPTHSTLPRGPVRSFLRTDLAAVGRDPLLIVIGCSPVLLALAVRFGYPPVHGWLTAAYGFSLEPYRPLLLAVIVLHTAQTFGMVGALLVLDDADDRALTALRTSPLTPPRYLGYRAGLMTAAALAGLLAVTLLSGLASSVSWTGLAAGVPVAALLAPLLMCATLAMASNKVEGIGALKFLGLALYLPVVAWWLTDPLDWFLAVLPPWWVLQALWADWGYAAGGLAVTAAALPLLARRALARLGMRDG